jgi:site-specific DNA-adenine methylase
MSYPGGKGGAGVYQTIINQQPPHDVYIEPFLGGGSVMKLKRPASTNIGIDVDRSVIEGFGEARGIELMCLDGISYLQMEREDVAPNTLIYCDPPYLLSTRRGGEIYRHEMTDAQHGTFLDRVNLLPCMIQISGYWSKMYADALHNWRMIRYMAPTRRGYVEECLWMNYPAPTILHDYSYLGEDYRQRERIKRKAARWVQRVASLPELERKAILSAALQHRWI